MEKDKNRITLKDIAQQLNLTVTTVSRILLGQAQKYRLSKETAEKVLAAAKAANYRPNQTARALRTQRTYTIGLIVPDITDLFFSNIARIIENEARIKGYATILSDSNESTSVEIECVNSLDYHNIDGLIVCPIGLESDHLIDTFHKIPVILIDRYFADLDIPFVATDHYKGAFDAVEYLIQCGHYRIACIQGSVASFTSRERLKGFLSALKSNNITVEKAYILGNSFSMENGYHSAKLLLKQPQFPTAIFAQNNLIAMGVYKAIKEEGLEIPHDISIIAFDDPQHACLMSPSLSCVRQPSLEIGQIAVKMLMDQIDQGHPKTAAPVLLAPALVHRHSVQILTPPALSTT